MSRAKGDLQEAKRLLKETDLSAAEIAKQTGTKEQTVYYHLNKIRKKAPAEIPTHKGEVEDWKALYQSSQKLYEKEVEKNKSQAEYIEKLEIELKEAQQSVPTNNFEELYYLEKAAHEQLFKYLQIMKGEKANA